MIKKLWSEIGRRRVLRLSAGYAVGAILTLKLAGMLVGALPLPAWWYPSMVAAVLAGLPVAAAFGRIHDEPNQIGSPQGH